MDQLIKPLTFRDKPTSVPSEREFSATEDICRIKLPRPFRDFCSQYNGGLPSAENAFYAVPDDFAKFHNEYGPGVGGIVLDGLYGLPNDYPSCDARRECKSWDELSILLFPIGFDLVGNYVVVKNKQPEGRVFWFDHELWKSPGTPDLFPIASNLAQFYNSLADLPFMD